MILAAGRGERLRPLTDSVPKAMVQAGGKPLIAWHLERLAAAGYREAVVNVSHLAERIVEGIGTGERYGLRITYSREREPLARTVTLKLASKIETGPMQDVERLEGLYGGFNFLAMFTPGGTGNDVEKRLCEDKGTTPTLAGCEAPDGFGGGECIWPTAQRLLGKGVRIELVTGRRGRGVERHRPPERADAHEVS